MVVHLEPIEGSQTPERPIRWRAWCEIDGRRFEADSRSGAPFALARTVEEAGFLALAGDGPVTVEVAGVAGNLTYPSLAWMALRAFAESPSHILCVRKHRDMGVF